jgi:hypothetical protein
MKLQRNKFWRDPPLKCATSPALQPTAGDIIKLALIYGGFNPPVLIRDPVEMRVRVRELQVVSTRIREREKGMREASPKVASTWVYHDLDKAGHGCVHEPYTGWGV